MDSRVREALKLITEAVAPPMTRGQALEELGAAKDDIEVQIECIMDELRSAGQDWGS